MGLAIAAIAGGLAYAILNAGLMLYARSFSINQSHRMAREALDRLRLDFYLSTGSARLTDSTGNLVSGTGPAAGIRYDRFVSGPYLLDSDANANSTSVVIQRRLPEPVAGQLLLCGNPVVRAPIQAVRSGGSDTLILDLSSQLGTYATPPVSGSALLLPSNTPVTTAETTYVLAQPGGSGTVVLRYFSGNLSGNGTVLAELDGSNPANAQPFSASAQQGNIDFALSLDVPDYSRRIGTYSRRMHLQTTLTPK